MSSANKSIMPVQAPTSRPGGTSKRPTLSVIIPVYNGTDYLQQCLAALTASTYDDFDVLVVDDGSTEPVEPLVMAYSLGYLRLDGPRGPACARNRGAAHAKGQYLVFLDADVCVHPDTLARVAAAFAADPQLDAVIGCYNEAPAAPNFLSRYKNLFHHYMHHACNGDISTFWSGCGAVKRELFLAFGGFDERRYRRPAIEDIELGTWMSVAGHRIVLDNQIKVQHLKRWSLWSLLKTDIVDRGLPWVHLMLRVGTITTTLNVQPTQRLSVVLVYLMILLSLCAMGHAVAWLGAGALACIVTAVNWDFYRYLTKLSGIWFTMRVIPLHWLYFGYCGLCVIWGTLLYCLTSDPRHSGGDMPPAALVVTEWERERDRLGSPTAEGVHHAERHYR